MEEKEFENLLLVEGINAKGFGTIAKMVMIDRRLHPYSKAIYSYFILIFVHLLGVVLQHSLAYLKLCTT